MGDISLPHLDETTLNEYLDDALPAAQRAQAEAHLAACARCAGELAALARLFAALEALPDLAPPRNLSVAVLAKLRPTPTLPRRFALLVTFQAWAALLFLVLAWGLLAPPLASLALPPLSLPLAEMAQSVETLAAIGREAISGIGVWLPALPWLESSPYMAGALLLWLLSNGLLLRVSPTLSEKEPS